MAMRSAERLLNLLPSIGGNSQTQSEKDRSARTYYSSSIGEIVSSTGGDFASSGKIFNDLGQLTDGKVILYPNNMRAIRDF